jgi:hypothetical protein
MSHRSSLLAAAAAVIVLSAAPATAQSPFATLAGSWSGSGQIKLVDGKTETIRCRATYSNKGTGLGISLRCASSANKIEMYATLDSQGSDVTGRWEERTFNATGDINGQATASKLNLAISGGVNGSMLVLVNSTGHSVSISTDNPTLKGVNINLSRG